MKKVAMVVLIFFVFGCAGPRFASEAQYDKGEWKGSAYLNEVNQIKRDKHNQKSADLALKKLEMQSVDTKKENGALQGYKGLIHNLSNYERVNVVLVGSEKKSYFLSPGEKIEDYLLPGKYCATFFANGKKVGKWEFNIGVQKHRYMGQETHWYLVYAP